MSFADEVVLDLLEERTGYRFEMHQLLTLALALKGAGMPGGLVESRLAYLHRHPSLTAQHAEAIWLDGEVTACKSTLAEARRHQAATGETYYIGRYSAQHWAIRRLEELGFTIAGGDM